MTKARILADLISDNAELADGTMTAFSALTQIMRLHQITCGHVTTDDGKVKELKSNRLSECELIWRHTYG